MELDEYRLQRIEAAAHSLEQALGALTDALIKIHDNSANTAEAMQKTRAALGMKEPTT